MTKQEKIQEAYGENWELVKNNVNENGWIKDREFTFKDFKPMNWQTTDHDDELYDTRRPVSLKGIENNNGWIKIESEDDLKVQEGYYAVFNTRWKHNEISIIQIIEPYKLDSTITHYQPISKPLEPLY